MFVLLLEVINMEESLEEKLKRIKIKEERMRTEEIERRSKAFCSDKKKSIDSFIEMLEELSYEDRLNKIKFISKSDLKKVSEALGKGVKSDVHTINCLLSNRVGYNKLRNK